MPTKTYTNGNGYHPHLPPVIENEPQLSDPPAERAAIGAALIDPSQVPSLLSTLTHTDYSLAKHALIHKAIAQLSHDHIPVDLITLADAMDKAGTLTDAGGTSYLAAIVNECPASLYLTNYAAIVARYAWLRRAITIGQSIVTKAYTQSNADELYMYVKQQMDLLSPHTSTTNLLDWDASHEWYLSILNQRDKESQLGPSPWRYPWPSWNEPLTPADPGSLIMLAGDTGTGKTIILECLSEWWAMQGIQVLFAHWELNWELMVDRRMARHSGVPRSTLRTGNLTVPQTHAVKAAEQRMKAWPGKVHLLSANTLNVDQFAAEVHTYHRQGKAQALIVDYLDMLSASPRQTATFGPRRFDSDADSLATIKALGEQLNLRPVTATQLRKTGKDAITVDGITLNDLEGSGQKANKANVVTLLHRPILNDGTRSNTLGVKLAKNTMGPLATWRQKMTPERFTVGDLPSKK